MFLRSVSAYSLSEKSLLFLRSLHNTLVNKPVVFLFLKVTAGFHRRPWKEQGPYSSWDIFILGWFLFTGFWHWHELNDFPELKNLLYTLDVKYMWYLPPPNSNGVGSLAYYFKGSKNWKEVNVEPSIGKSRKHPWLSQKVLAFRLLNWIMFIIVVVFLCF